MTNDDDISPSDLFSCDDQPAGLNLNNNNELHRISTDARKPVQYLIQIQKDHDELKAQFNKDRGALEAKYEELYQPLYDKRYNIVNAIGVNTTEPATTNQEERGIPEFWLRALKGYGEINIYIEHYDEGALKHLENIKWHRTENLKGFKLEFYFRRNLFFKNSVLTVTYHMLDEDEFLIDKIVGTEIEWYPEKRLKKRKSFFDLFSSLEVDNQYYKKGRLKYVLQGYYLIGSIIRDDIISRAVLWFTGEARLERMFEITKKHSCFLKNLSRDVKRRVDHLKNIQRDHDRLKAQFYRERAELEAKYQRFYDKIYNERCGIVNGVVEAEKRINDSEAVNQELAPEEKGVPNFWYHAMVNHELLDSEITLRDGEALKYLTDIKWLRKDDSKTKGFILEFCFNDNPFFKNSVLTKTYQFLDYDETILYKAIGMEIEWYPENCLTKERESFFDFFHPLEIDEWDAKELIEDMRRDYYIGSIIRNQIIPRAVLWYLDEAVPGDKVVGVTDSETDDWYYYDDQITEDEDDESENEDDESENEDEDDESENEDNI